MDSRLVILNTVFFVFAMARSATNQWFIVYFFDYFNILECDLLFGCRLGIRFISSVIWGYLSDYYSNKKLHFFIIAHIASAFLSTLFLYESVITDFTMTMVVLSIESFCGGANSLIDTVTVLIAPKNTYGKSRFWFAFGVGFGAIVCGALGYYLSSNTIYIHFYNIAIVLTCIILVIAMYLSPKLSHPDYKSVVSNIQSDIESDLDINDDSVIPVTHSGLDLFVEFIQIICTHPIVIMFNTDLFIFGIAHAFVGQSLFIYLLNEFNATEYLCGLTIMSMICGELIIFYFSTYLLERVGIIGLLLISHLSYAFRVIIYTFIPHSQSYTYLFLLIEPLHGFTFAGMWIGCIEYASRISPTHLKATMIGTVSGIYTGLGNMCGAFIAGYMYHNFGGDFMFRLAGIVILLWTVFIQLIYKWLHYSFPNKFTSAIY